MFTRFDLFVKDRNENESEQLVFWNPEIQSIKNGYYRYGIQLLIEVNVGSLNVSIWESLVARTFMIRS